MKEEKMNDQEVVNCIIYEKENEIRTEDSRRLRIEYLNCNGIKNKTQIIEKIIMNQKLNLIAWDDTHLRAQDKIGIRTIVRKDYNNDQIPKRGMRGSILF